MKSMDPHIKVLQCFFSFIYNIILESITLNKLATFKFGATGEYIVFLVLLYSKSRC